jgi:hypothetical protein
MEQQGAAALELDEQELAVSTHAGEGTASEAADKDRWRE